MIFDYWELFFIDLTVWLLCLGLMLRFGRLTVLHPASLYFFFHLYTFTFRLFQLANGAPTLFASWGPQFLPVTHREIQRASFVALTALVIMTIVWLYLAHQDQRRPDPSVDEERYRPFSKRLMWMVVSITLPVGIVALLLFRGPMLSGGPTLSLGAWSGSSYLMSMYQWSGISLLALVFYYGFRRIILIPLLLYLFIGLLTFPFRMMVIVPSLFIVFTYLRRNQIKWPTMRLVVLFVALSLLFVAGKDFGPRLREGDYSGAWDLLVGRVVDLREGMHTDETFMDQMAVALSQVDERGRFYYGRTYANLLLLPIPRAFWPDKPGQADWQKDIQTPGRPTAEMGAIVTTYGEAYANFGYVGVVLYALALAVLLHRLYRWMSRAPYYSLVNFWSLCVYAILVQVFRDGFASFVTFQVSIFMPLTAITLLHLVALRRRRVGGKVLGWSTIFDPPNVYLDAQGQTYYRSYASGSQSAR